MSVSVCVRACVHVAEQLERACLFFHSLQGENSYGPERDRRGSVLTTPTGKASHHAMLPKLHKRQFQQTAGNERYCASLPTGPGGVIGEGGVSNGGLIHRVGSLTKMPNGSDHDEHYRRGDSVRSSVNHHHHHHHVRHPSVRNGTLDHNHKRPSYNKNARCVGFFSVTSITLAELCCPSFETIKTTGRAPSQDVF